MAFTADMSLGHGKQNLASGPSAAGYLRYVAEPLGQKVVILRGGFQQFEKIGGDLGKPLYTSVFECPTDQTCSIVVPRKV